MKAVCFSAIRSKNGPVFVLSHVYDSKITKTVPRAERSERCIRFLTMRDY